jgi:hypothetical protein
MHQIGRDAEAIDLASSARGDTLRRIESDSASLTSLAQSYSALGDHNEALSLIRRALWSYQSSRRAPPIDLEMASCWIFMDAGDDVSLGSTLRGLDARKEISPAQSAVLRDIWIAGSLKRADAAMSAGANQAGLAILDSARRALPNEVKVRAAFAAGLAYGSTPLSFPAAPLFPGFGKGGRYDLPRSRAPSATQVRPALEQNQPPPNPQKNCLGPAASPQLP